MSEQQHSDHRADGGIGGGQECLLCPVCVLLQALHSTKPEVTRHLLAAGRELTLALQALLEQHIEAAGEPDTSLERIDVE